MARHLPREILTATAVYLQGNDLWTCVQVCHLWKDALNPVLYGVVDICSLRQFKLFTRTLRSTENLHPLGHLVRKLKLWTDMDHTKLASLPRLCPFAIAFETYKHWSSASYSRVLREWTHLMRVPELSLYKHPDFPLDFFRDRVTRLTIHIAKYPNWIDLVTAFPRTESLTVNCSGCAGIANNAKVSLLELESVHEALPRLQSFHLYHFFICGKTLASVAVCDTVRSLRLIPLDNYLWGQYFSQKYTKLEILSVSGRRSNTEKIKEEAMKLTKSCRHLKSLETSESNGFYRQFLEALQKMSAPISCLNFYCWDMYAYGVIVKGFCHTLSKVEFCTSEKTSSEEILAPLRSCSSLVELKLYGMDIDYEIDRVLNYCARLETLYIGGNTLGVNNGNAAENRYNLRSLIIRGVTIKDEVFLYLNQSCPRLSILKCAYATASRRRYTIDLQNLCLEKLEVHCMNDPVFELTLVNKSKQILERTRQFHGSVDEHKIKGWTRWYRKKLDRNRCSLLRLRPQEINRIQGQLCTGYSRENNESSQGAGARNQLSCITKNTTISIQCRSARHIYLQNVHL